MCRYELEEPDYDSHEAEQERLNRMRKRLKHEYEMAEERIEENE